MSKSRLRPLVFLIITIILSMGLATPARARSWNTQAIVVNTTADELSNDGNCSLREAIRAANTDTPVDACPAGYGNDVIDIPPGLFPLAINGANEDEGLSGDLDILGDLTLRGSGPDYTFLDGNQIDRVIHIAGMVTVQISNLTVQNGYASGSGLYGGGGILNEKGNLTLTGAVIRDNRTGKVGGGIDNANTAVLIDTTITGNQANSGGGVFNTGSLLVENCAILSNTSNVNGGGLDNRDKGTVINSTFSGNMALTGGGIINDGELTLHNVTISGNSTGLANAFDVRFKSTLVANSTGGNNCTGEGTFTSEGYNLDSGTSCNFTNLGDMSGTEPLLGPLSVNEGRTLTHALQTGSPAVDHGDNADCPQTDQRGASRPADGDGDGAAACDIGAFESGGSLPMPVFIPLINSK